MFGKLMPGNGGTQKDISKDINESVKTLSYLARAEKYFDLELNKNGQITKPLLRIIDVIEPLRKIYSLSQKLEKGTNPEGFELNALDHSPEIIDVVNDILSLSPKGLVSSDKVVLAKLHMRLDELKKATGRAPQMTPPPTEEVIEKKRKAYSGKLFGQKIAGREDDELPAPAEEPEVQIPDSFFNYNTPAPEYNSAPEPILEPRDNYQSNDAVALQPSSSKPQINDENFWDSAKLQEPLEWDRPPTATLDINEAAVEVDAPIIQEYAESGVHEPVAPPSPAHFEPVYIQPSPQPSVAPTPMPTMSKPVEAPPTPAATPHVSKEPRSYLPQKYFATSYAGMNLQEAAEIISDLNNNPANRDIILLEHSSRVKPIALGNEIVGDLLAIAPIADSFETGSEIIDKAHLTVLKDAERIISICRDIANVKIEGFDKRKQKLFEKFLPNDIRKTLELAKVAYPEFFSSADMKGETTSSTLLDFSDIILEFANQTGDKLFAELMSQIIVQIALYAEHNDLRLKFDLTTKKNKLHAETQALESRSEIAALRSVTFVPKIARHAQDVLSVDNIADKQESTVDKALEILQLIYVHARDNYSAEMQNFYSNKAA